MTTIGVGMCGIYAVVMDKPVYLDVAIIMPISVKQIIKHVTTNITSDVFVMVFAVRGLKGHFLPVDQRSRIEEMRMMMMGGSGAAGGDYHVD